MTPRRVLLLHSSSGRYGADRQLQLIATGLDPARYEPLVVLPDRGPLAADLERGGTEVLVRPLSVLRRGEVNLPALIASAARDGRALGALISERGVALVHSNTSVILGGAASARLARVPHVFHVRENYERFTRAWPLYRRTLMTAAALPCVSRATAAQFPPSPRVRVIYDGLALDPRRSGKLEARAALGIEPDRPLIAILGRVSDWKGQDVLVRALAEPPLASRGALGLIAGEAWPGAENRMTAVTELASQLAISERLRPVGFRDDVDTVYGAADLVVVPSTQPDPLPGAAIEAAAAGCTVIASNTGGLPEIISDHATGRLFAPGDAAALARIAAELLDNPDQRDRLGRAAASEVRERFAPARLRGAIGALYDELLD